jgi:hypothetical protein
MGNCVSAGATEVSDEDKRRHREAEKSLKEVRVELQLSTAYMYIFGVRFPMCSRLNICFQARQKLASQVKVSAAAPSALPYFLTYSQGIIIRVRGFRKIYHPQGM